MKIHLIVEQKLTCTTVVHVYACHRENTQVTPLALVYIHKVKPHTTVSLDQFCCQKLLSKMNALSIINLFTLIDRKHVQWGHNEYCVHRMSLLVFLLATLKFNQPYFMKIQPTVFLAMIMTDTLLIFQTAIIPVFIYVIICNATCL